jgi:hypothetical protein
MAEEPMRAGDGVRAVLAVLAAQPLPVGSVGSDVHFKSFLSRGFAARRS